VSQPTIDVALLRKELEYVTAHRDQWEQREWIARHYCGTTGCLAGNVVLNAGYRPSWKSNDASSAAYVTLPDDPHVVRSVRGVARDLLGLDEEQSNVMFASHNTLHDLWQLAAELTDGAIRVPADVYPEYPPAN
jgi:hypothetical protein